MGRAKKPPLPAPPQHRRDDPRRHVQHPGIRQQQVRKAASHGRVAAVVRRFDVVAIQEIRSTSDDIIPRFVHLVNGRRTTSTSSGRGWAAP